MDSERRSSTPSGAERDAIDLAEPRQTEDADEVIAQVTDDSKPVPTWAGTTNITGVGSTAPGQSNSAIVELTPNAEYLYFCTESTDSGTSRATNGMSGTFTTGDDSGATMPDDADATVVATEYHFRIDGLHAGHNTVEFTNSGKMIHHVGIIPLMPGKTLDDVKAMFASESEPQGPPRSTSRRRSSRRSPAPATR